MPIITFANTKGGAGKTTVALVAATELARLGYRVALLDADPQQWASRWFNLSDTAVNIDVIADVSAETIERQAKDLKKRTDYIIIDLPGGVNPLLAKAIGLSDHVMVPVQGSTMDAVGGAQVLDILKELAVQCDIRIAHSVVLTRINSIINTRAMVAVKSLLAEQQVHILETPLVERAAYRDMFISGGTLSSMDPQRVSNLDKAQENARMFVEEIVRLVPLKIAKTRTPRKPAAIKQAA
jgi:chromosome partitioning protein